MAIAREWVERFNAKWRADESGCWVWHGARTTKGYGFIKVPKQRRQIYAHRLSYEIHVGEVPSGKQVLHRCDSPSCVNPSHLFTGTAEDNAQDMRAKGRHLYGERNAEAILTSVEVRKIKAMLRTGQFSQLEISRIFGVAQITISRIHRGLRWAHIE